MAGRIWLLVALLLASRARAAEIVDATGRHVTVPDHIAHVLPAGPPAAVLMAVLAPDLMLGWPHGPPEAARDWLPPEVAGLPAVPAVTGKADVTEAVKKLAPDLVLDYGNTTPRYQDLARGLASRTGIPTVLLDGNLRGVPGVLRALGALLHREGRAEALARMAEALLDMQPPGGADTRVVYARGADGLDLAPPEAPAAEVFSLLGWKVLAPPKGAGRPVTVADIARLDPDFIVFQDPAARAAVKGAAAWRGVRAVREGHAFVAPATPFGWVTEPPSLNRLLGVAWLSGADPVTACWLFSAVMFGRVPTQAALARVAESLRPVSP